MPLLSSEFSRAPFALRPGSHAPHSPAYLHTLSCPIRALTSSTPHCSLLALLSVHGSPLFLKHPRHSPVSGFLHCFLLPLLGTLFLQIATRLPPSGLCKIAPPRGTWVAQWLSGCLWLRSGSQGPGIESCIRLSAASLLLPLPMSLPLSLCLL